MKTRIHSLSNFLAWLILAVIAAYALFFLIRGMEGQMVYENSSVSTTTYTPLPLAIIPLALAIVTGWALFKKKGGFVWLGWALLAAFSIITIFSIGYGLIFIEAALFICLLSAQLSKRALHL